MFRMLFVLSVTNKPFMLSVVMLNIVVPQNVSKVHGDLFSSVPSYNQICQMVYISIRGIQTTYNVLFTFDRGRGHIVSNSLYFC
jgi:hypothetical protein